MTRRRAALPAVAASGLPPALKLYLASAACRARRFSFGPALKKDQAAFAAAVERLVSEAAGVLGCSGEEALFLTGFGANNMAPHRLEAALAELLAVLFLRAAGFSGIGLIAPGPGRTADIAAVKDGLKWAAEVRCLTAGGVFDAELLGGKFGSKLPQARNAVKKYGFDRGLVVLVREPWNFKAFAPDQRLAELAREAYSLAERPGSARLCLLDAEGSGVYPAW